MTPLFGQTYKRAKASNSKEEFLKSKEASNTAVAWGSALVGSALQSYGVGALINATGTLSYKGSAYLGALIFAATSAPGVCPTVLCSSLCQSVTNFTMQFINSLIVEKQTLETIGVGALAKLVETVGLSVFLTWWGTRTSPFEL